MERERVAFVLITDLDPVPGPFSTQESAHQVIEALMLNSLGHYHPVVIPFKD